MAIMVAVPLSSFISAVLATPAPPLLWGMLLAVIIGVGIVAGVMLLKGYDRRKTLRAMQAMPMNALFVETSRLGQRTVIARGHVPPSPPRPSVHLVSDNREALGK